MGIVSVCLDCPHYQNGGYCRKKQKTVSALAPACEASKTPDEDLMDDELSEELSDELGDELGDELDEDSDEELEENETPFEPDEN